MAAAVQKMKKFMEEMGDTTRKLEHVLSEIRGGEDDRDEEIQQEQLGTAEMARRRVRGYFQQLRDQLCVQEVAALTVVDTHVRERMCSIRQQEEDMATILSQAEIQIGFFSMKRLTFLKTMLGREINHHFKFELCLILHR